MERRFKVVTRDDSKMEIEDGFRDRWGPFTDEEADAFLAGLNYAGDPDISALKLLVQAGDELRKPDHYYPGFVPMAGST